MTDQPPLPPSPLPPPDDPNVRMVSPYWQGMQPAPAPRRRWPRYLLLAVLPLLLLVAGGVGVWIIASQPTALERACEECAANDSGVRLGDDGHTMVVSRVLAEEDPGASWLTWACIADELDMPDAVDERMSHTRALDGTQTADWDEITASWTYHPTNGLSVILQEH